jgi:hypothetical protein
LYPAPLAQDTPGDFALGFFDAATHKIPAFDCQSQMRTALCRRQSAERTVSLVNHFVNLRPLCSSAYRVSPNGVKNENPIWRSLWTARYSRALSSFLLKAAEYTALQTLRELWKRIPSGEAFGLRGIPALLSSFLLKAAVADQRC